MVESHPAMSITLRASRIHPRSTTRMGRQCLLLLASCCVVASCAATVQDTGFGPVPAGMTVQLSDEYYDVFGSNASDIRRAMRESGPMSDGRRWDANARWNVAYRYRYAMRAGACRMTDVTVVYTSTILLPRWSRPADATLTVRQQWAEYMRALRTHEEGHRNIGAEAAREVLRRVRNVTSPHCADMSARANALGRRTLDEFRAMQRQYDEATGHGRTQGAVWPPPG